MSSLTVNWQSCGDDAHWCNFHNLNLNSDHFNDLRGVYIIWSNVDGVIRIGSGIIKDRIADHRDDEEINGYGSLNVTWARVNANQMQGVEKYLADELNPEVGERFPNRTPIPVNLPQW